MSRSRLATRATSFPRIGETSASWTRIMTLGPEGFPVDRFGDDDVNDSPDVSSESCIVAMRSKIGLR
jgi:hypothetical protein